MYIKKLSQNGMRKDRFDLTRDCTKFQVMDGIIHNIHSQVTIMRIIIHILYFLHEIAVQNLKNCTLITAMTAFFPAGKKRGRLIDY